MALLKLMAPIDSVQRPVAPVAQAAAEVVFYDWVCKG